MRCGLVKGLPGKGKGKGLKGGKGMNAKLSQCVQPDSTSSTQHQSVHAIFKPIATNLGTVQALPVRGLVSALQNCSEGDYSV